MNFPRPVRGLLLLLAALAAVPSSAAAATCSDYSNQADAQAAKDTRDADGDGKYCETLPCPCAGGGSTGGGSSNSNGDAARQRRAAAERRQATERRQAAARRARADRRRRAAIRAQREGERKERLARQRLERGLWRVSQVIDGDTLRVRRTDGRGAETVNLVGLDAPETQAGVPAECGGAAATATLLALGFQGVLDTNGDGFFDAPNGRGVLVSLTTDRSQDVRDPDGRLNAFVDAEDDLPPFAQDNGYDFGLVQVQAGNATVEETDGSRSGNCSKAAAAAEAAPRGVWQSCGGNFHAET